ncbi:hypothetical protein [Candidatus Neptunochlamydia vexilliferae]|uniref:Uncharacterized protein n=1 Tax=Candidatus Neptunichlamydia vexilliferae TaxID=1651774 RepID=A0ABS0AZ20_9BACT|nr:hypothetical protein [Candidatus Neptunochlamydia vexilliferae]MBF5059220.1 hypothetical protein [Candidatus Neptunochlamydia vexilliferae]
MKKYLTLLLLSLMTLASAAQVSFPNTSGGTLEVGEHRIAVITSSGIVEIENRAQFRVVAADLYTVVDNWSVHDRLSFSSNPYPFAKGEFFITNLSRGGEYVQADFTQAPLIGHPETNRIVEINSDEGEVVLINGQGKQTRWEIELSDLSMLEEWRKGDSILVGMNDNWCSCVFSSCPNILASYEAKRTILYLHATLKEEK